MTMLGAPSSAATALLGMLMVVHAQAQTIALDANWEGTWQCEASDSASAFTSPMVAIISGSQIKLSRASNTSDEVLNGTVDANGSVSLSGRGTRADGQRILSSITGTLSGRSLTASGRVVPLAGGAVQTCALALTPVGASARPAIYTYPYAYPAAHHHGHHGHH